MSGSKRFDTLTYAENALAPAMTDAIPMQNID
jgi:hypothetical protein